jgi:hypothetical protein
MGADIQGRTRAAEKNIAVMDARLHLWGTSATFRFHCARSRRIVFRNGLADE